MLWVALAVACATACYKPGTANNCAISCDPQLGGADCPDDLTCGTSGRCGAVNITCLPDGGIVEVDMMTDAPFCFGVGNPVCFDTIPSGSIELTSFDTTNCGTVGTQMSVGGVPSCVIAGDKVEMTGVVTITGPLPLVVVGVSAVTVPNQAVLDVSSTSRPEGTRLGPGGNFLGCTTAATVAAPFGGTGGSFGGSGGQGYNGQASPPKPAIGFHGGCHGSQTGLVKGGDGGGAVYLVSADQIAINGVVLADGAGGKGGPAPQRGGGGGGSGGYVGLDAPMISYGNNGKVFAVGGGGGAGSDVNADGLPGNEATPASAADNTGGSPSGGGGVGGQGGLGNDGLMGEVPGSGDPINDGGGGGGGGTGVIQIFGSTDTCSVCIPAQLP